MLLDVNDLHIELPSGKCVADHISFQIESGQMLSIVGGSGAGKTTVCRAVMGLLDTDYQAGGEILFAGKNLLTLPWREGRKLYGKEISYIMQNPMTAFNPSIRVGKQLEKTYYRHHDKLSKGELQQKVKSTLHRLGLEDTERILKDYPFALSGGMLQRLMIAAALINEPKLLVADEVTTAIDACNRMELMQQLKAFCKEGMAVLFVTHDLRSAAGADQLLIMNNGSVVESGQTQTLLQYPKEEYTRQLLNACQLERRECS